MSAITVQAIRQRAETALTAVSGFNRSPLAFDVFGRDPSALLHRGFAVGTPSSVWTERGRQKVSVGSLNETRISVRFAFKLRIKDQRSSYDDALADEQTIIKTVVGISRVDITGPVYVDTPRREILPDGEWFFGEVNFAAQHLLALE